MSPTIAFFDVDKTILSVNSAPLWIRREVRLGHLGRWQALKGLWWGLLYALGMARMERVIASAVGTLRGQRERDIHERSVAFWREEVRGFVRPAARAAVEAHRAQGHRIVLLTTTSIYLAREIADELGCDAILCNRMTVSEGLFTGEIEPPLCFGEGKATHAAALAASLGVPLGACCYYGDSYSDVPILAAVGEPVAVNPDPRLRRYAARRGWRIADWEADSGAGAPSLTAKNLA